ncbi:unnamed protein product [Paramecium octaurelia]|uniref:Uncharacterized protein n=1 Tax=Paramecium octaurelia TaxID=43137 RepID=A0A8S1WAP9_PAROT|nr:unnamed protein product [Paramecium octaurelia]
MIHPGSSMSKQSKIFALGRGGIAGTVQLMQKIKIFILFYNLFFLNNIMKKIFHCWMQIISKLKNNVKNRNWVGTVALLENEQYNFIFRKVSDNYSHAEHKLSLAYAYYRNGDYKCKRNDQNSLQSVELSSQTVINKLYQNKKIWAIEELTLLLIDQRQYTALNIYLALLYYNMQYYDVSMQMLSLYLSQYLNSITARNLKACNLLYFQCGKTAEEEVVKSLQQAYEGENMVEDNDSLRHNLVVIRGGNNVLIFALFQLRSSLKPIKSYCLLFKKNYIQEAFNLAKDLYPNLPREYIINAIAYFMKGQSNVESNEAIQNGSIIIL